jgi:hypothetical protein
MTESTRFGKTISDAVQKIIEENQGKRLIFGTLGTLRTNQCNENVFA